MISGLACCVIFGIYRRGNGHRHARFMVVAQVGWAGPAVRLGPQGAGAGNPGVAMPVRLGRDGLPRRPCCNGLRTGAAGQVGCFLFRFLIKVLGSEPMQQAFG